MLLIRKSGEMGWHTPQITAYPNELAMETLIAQSPDLLPGSAGQRLVVATQLTVPLIGYVDLVGVDLDGNITIVECKLESNPEIRRKVVGQVFAYAAGLWKLSYEAFDQAFADKHGKPLAQAVGDLSVGGWEEESFRANVGSNLAAGRFRLVIAVDRITDELKQIILYLNQHTVTDLQILALELGYVADEGVEVILPVVYGEESAQTKATSSPATAPRKWDKDSVFAALAQYSSQTGLEAAQQLYNFASSRGAKFYYNNGPWPAVTAQFPFNGKWVSAFSIYPSAESKSTFAINFEYFTKHFPGETLAELANHLRGIPGIAAQFKGLEGAGYKKRPGLSIEQVLAQPSAAKMIQNALDELLRKNP